MAAGVYIHVPFCISRCSYCDFATDILRDDALVERYIAALSSEIQSSKVEISTSVDTIYFGGGTPSLLSPKQLESLMKAVHSRFHIEADAEITMEMNPATVTPEKLDEFRDLGINRASFGVQTFNDRDLKLLARGHNAADARQTFKMLRDACFSNVSFDLIAGLPGQTMDDWLSNLNEAVQLSPEHISLYLLEIHSTTPLFEQISTGRRKPIEDELAAEMYETMLDTLDSHGYQQYEISNFTKPGFASRHNTKYWRLQPVFGYGVSAHSFDGKQRYSNVRDTVTYIDLINESASAEILREDIDLASEHVFLGMRLEDGIDIAEHSRLFGRDLLEKYARDIDDLVEKALISVKNGRLKLTRRGKLFSNEVFEVFV